MHPSRLVSLALLGVGVLLIAQAGLIDGFQATASTILLLLGGIALLGSSLYGLVQYENSPIVTEYGVMTYLLLFGLLLWAVGMTARLITG